MANWAGDYLKRMKDKREQGQGEGSERDRYLDLWDQDLDKYNQKMDSNRDWRDEMTVKSQLVPLAHRGWGEEALIRASEGATGGAAMGGPIGAIIGGGAGALLGGIKSGIEAGQAGERIGNKDPWANAANPFNNMAGATDEELLAAGMAGGGGGVGSSTAGMMGDMGGQFAGLFGDEYDYGGGSSEPGGDLSLGGFGDQLSMDADASEYGSYPGVPGDFQMAAPGDLSMKGPGSEEEDEYVPGAVALNLKRGRRK